MLKKYFLTKKENKMNDKKKITITLPADTAELLEKKCKQLNMSKSDYINKIITSNNNAGRKEKFSEEDKTKILELSNMGVPISKIAKKFNCSRNTVYKIIE